MLREKVSLFRYDRKLDEEVRKYDPFGRGGGGAPMRDYDGNVMGKFVCFFLRNSLALLLKSAYFTKESRKEKKRESLDCTCFYSVSV